jgi:hypothetical protein
MLNETVVATVFALLASSASMTMEWSWHDEVLWVANLILAVVGVGGIIVAVLTLVKIERQTKATEYAVKAARDSYTLAESTAKRQLRAYIVVRNAHLILHEDGAVEAKMELVNCGQTPAYELRGGVICGFAVYPIRNVKPFDDEMRQSVSTIGAGLGSWVLYPQWRHDKENREYLLRKLDGGGSFVYCARGYYVYRDTFNDPHWLKFQLIIGGPAGVRVDSEGIRQWASFSNDSEGNEEG